MIKKVDWLSSYGMEGVEIMGAADIVQLFLRNHLLKDVIILHDYFSVQFILLDPIILAVPPGAYGFFDLSGFLGRAIRMCGVDVGF